MEERTERALKTAETLLRRLDSANKFGERYTTPVEDLTEISDQMIGLADSIPEIKSPVDRDELLLSEVKRRMQGQGTHISQNLGGELYDFDKVTKIFAIPGEDLNSLKEWLDENRDRTKDSISRLFRSRDVREYDLPVRDDVPRIRRQAEEVAGAHIDRYHRIIGKHLEGLTQVGNFVRDVTVDPTTKGRSYYNPVINKVGVSIPGILFSKEDGTLGLRADELIRIYGHECMGHALNFTVSRASNLPHMLTENSSLIAGTAESVAQFYERQLLEDLKDSPDTQTALGIKHNFGEIYEEARDSEQFREFAKRLGFYSIKVLGDKSLGDPRDPAVIQRKTQMLTEVAIDRSNIAGWVESHKNEFDSQGNLGPGIVSELIYCAQPVPRAMGEFSKNGIYYVGEGRSHIDRALLTGLWTPTGFVHNARLKAEELSK